MITTLLKDRECIVLNAKLEQAGVSCEAGKTTVDTLAGSILKNVSR